MNKQRKVLITITYNEMGIIIDTKAEEVAQPELTQDLHSTCADAISRQAAIDAMCSACCDWCDEGVCERASALQQLPSAQPEIIRCKDCKWYNDRERICNDLMGFGRYWKPDDFCSYGKRRTDENNND